LAKVPEIVKFFRYSGSKDRFASYFNELSKNLSEDLFIEPFLGSGAVFINTRFFNKCIINDIDENIISIFNAVKYNSYSKFVEISKSIKEHFGDIKQNKESYYKFREFYNKTWHFVKQEDYNKFYEKGIYLYFLANSCINSFLRFGPNGMNQSFGGRSFIFSNYDYDTIKSKLEFSEIFNTDWINLKYLYKNSILFLDPPYYKRKTSYTNSIDSINELSTFIDNVLSVSIENKIIYTDIENKISDVLLENGFKKDIIRNVRNSSPNRINEYIQMNEVVYYNF
jgi:DNA adenine methylase/adenine-specific DNA-methyltransferase